MIYLVDTNILSEIRKAGRGDRNVAGWFASVSEDDVFTSVIVTGEIRRGIELLRPRDPVQAAALQRWLETVDSTFAGRILAIDRLIAEEWGRLSAIRTVPVADGLLAATARVHGMTLATRNERHFAGLGVAVLNPFRFAS